MSKQVREGEIVTHKHVLGDQDVKVVTVNRASNYAVIQLDPENGNAKTARITSVTLDKLEAK